MEIAIIGLGKMGLGISNRLIKRGHTVFGYDSDWGNSDYSKNNINGSSNLDDLINKFSQKSKKIIWVMVPSGDPTKSTISKLKTLFAVLERIDPIKDPPSLSPPFEYLVPLIKS